MRLPRVKKEKSLGEIIKVYTVIDFMVLNELKDNHDQHIANLLEAIQVTLGGKVGVSSSYLCKRISVLEEKGYVRQYWGDPDTRYNRFIALTDEGSRQLGKYTEDIKKELTFSVEVYNGLLSYLNNNKL